MLFFGRMIIVANESARICSRQTLSLFCSRCLRGILRVLQIPIGIIRRIDEIRGTVFGFLCGQCRYHELV